ncbi:MAG TPA: LamG-like jellyroll fold domain-containing protein [Verrucomicrobiae bacterium]|nr:LamG-like jellyroll fold domain-containing protein [Verrucomicrobiae bacterium]
MSFVDEPSDMRANTFLRAWGGTFRLLSLVAVLVFYFGVVPLAVRAASVGSQAVLRSLPTSDQWAGEVNIRPGSNETVALNPPIFGWFGAPGIPEYIPYDTNVYEYIFQADYNGAFTNPVVNVTTFSCCYNLLAPFTSSPVYWRVGYLYNPSNNMSSLTNLVWTTNSWITNTFNIATNARVWDRSVLGNTNYMAGKTHPYILFNGKNNGNIATYLASAFPSAYQNAMSGTPSTMMPAWYQNPAPWTSGVDYTTDASAICSAAFDWMVSGSPVWTNQLCSNYDNFINYFMTASLWSLDYGNGASPILPISMALTYDWIYPIMTPQERTNALTALRWQIRANLYNSFWVTPVNRAISCFPEGNGDGTSTFPGPLWCPFIMPSKMGGSHPWVCMQHAAFYEALACFNDDPNASLLLNLDLNYMIGRVTPYGASAVNQGRGYGLESTFHYGTIDNTLMAGTVFPEAHLNLNPAFNKLGEWWTHLAPPGYDDVHEQWGDVDFNTGAAFWHQPSAARDLGLLTQNGNFAMNDLQFSYFTGPFDNAESPEEMLYPFFYPTPAPTIDTNLGYCDPHEGWAFGSTYPPNTTNCFYSGVGFAFMARPRGSEAQHSHFNDLDFEIWAYGANITDGAGGSFVGNHASWMANTVLINGLGQTETEEQPMSPEVAEITAFTNAPDYVYVAADGTQAYPHQPFLYDYGAGANGPQGWLMGGFGGLNAGGPLAYVSAVHRELLFEHRKYFVIYDTVQTTNGTGNTFSWVYHIFQNNLATLNAGSFQFDSFTWGYTGNGVSGFTGTGGQLQTYVYQVVNSNEITSTDMNGTNVYLNPITGENYYASAVWDQMNGSGNTPSAHTIWVNNVVPTNKFHFMTVIYPVPPGGVAPTFTSLDDDTVQVVDGTNTDVISFNPQTTNMSSVTMLVDSPGIWSNTAALPSAPNLANSPYIVPTTVASSGPPPQTQSPPTPSNLRVVPPAAVSSITNLPANSSFTPVSGYLAWWDPDVLSGADTAPVTNWMDLSENGFTLSQANFRDQPVFRINGPNGHNYLSFNGTSDFMANTEVGPLTQPIEVFCVAYIANLTTYGAIAGNSSGGQVAFGVMNSQYFMNASDVATGGAVSNGWVEITAILNDTSSQLYVDGTLAVSGTRIGVDTQQGEAIGAYNNNNWGMGHFFNGAIGDVIIYNTVLSASDQQTVEKGLRAKYGF